MAANTYCPECHENFGKVTENGTELRCGTCGWSGLNRDLKEMYPKIYKETLADEKRWDVEDAKQKE